ncbi:enoyl-CoA hydratase/isomerase family protein [Halostella salina]|uniref:enoyl-CoA hydratase/isomerase family protein n=1 Tax=Halostella salina TaxID=1547897 RepID=UPI000EF80D69|nr:enoyl-CoA hydratase-related protein [Halostella salina]
MIRVERVHDGVRLEFVEGGDVARLVMERGDAPLNVFTPPQVEAMSEAVEALAGDVGALVLYGEPEFSGGADLRSVESAPEEMRAAKVDTIAAASNRFIRTLRRFPAPVIAAVSGVAAGGGLGFTLACDLVVLHRDAVLDTGYARVGLTPDNATPFFLAKTVGPYRARELLFDPRPIDAAEAVEMGLANRRIDRPDDEFVDAATEWAASLADGPTTVYEETKALIDSTFAGRLDEHLEEERDTIKRVSDSAVFEEGLAAFMDDRDPEWDKDG